LTCDSLNPKETYDVYIPERTDAERLWCFTFKHNPLDGFFMSHADQSYLVQKGLIYKDLEGRYLLTEQGAQVLAEQELAKHKGVT
jgi:hypothetical protein